MPNKKMNPEQRGRADRVRNSICFAAITPEDSPAPLEIQRACAISQAISRRVALSPTVATIVAQLAYGEAASCR